MDSARPLRLWNDAEPADRPLVLAAVRDLPASLRIKRRNHCLREAANLVRADDDDTWLVTSDLRAGEDLHERMIALRERLEDREFDESSIDGLLIGALVYAVRIVPTVRTIRAALAI
ncbi:MAG: hypothetical protein QM723_40605 [Myxococcaceae bacterium]